MPCLSFNRRPRTSRLRASAAYSLLEVVAAIGLMGATLVPAMELVRSSMEKSVENDQRQLLSLYAVSQIEQQLGVVEMTWATGSLTGDYAVDGHANIRYDTVVSDDPLNGGVIGQLMDLRTTVYVDDNGDDTLSSGELQCSFRTKIGRFATYEAKGP